MGEMRRATHEKSRIGGNRRGHLRRRSVGQGRRSANSCLCSLIQHLSVQRRYHAGVFKLQALRRTVELRMARTSGKRVEARREMNAAAGS